MLYLLTYDQASSDAMNNVIFLTITINHTRHAHCFTSSHSEIK